MRRTPLNVGVLFWCKGIDMSKRISAIIALDGEKKFKDDVTSVNKSLSNLKSELALVKESCVGQANTLESLSKKHEVLIKIQEAHRQKEEELIKGRDNAKAAQEKVADGLKKLKKQYQTANSEMAEMANNSETTEDKLKSQEKAIKELSDAIEKGEKNYRTATNRIQDWETKLNTAKSQTLKANRAVNENAAYLKEAEKSTDKCAKSIDAFGKETKEAEEATLGWKTALKGAAAEKAVEITAELGKSILEVAQSSEKAGKQIQASTGLSTESAKKYKDIMDEIYGSNYGDDFEDVGTAIGTIVQNLGELDPSSVKETAENAISLRDTFGMDYQEQLRSVKMLMDTFGVSSEEAYNLIAQGAQNGLDKNGDLLDTINEYSVHYKQLGLDAEEFFNSLSNGTAAGTFSVDKLGDAMKEFGIRTKDTATSTDEGFELLGLNADKMRKEFAKGGDSAKEATQTVLKELFKMDDEVKQNQAGVDLFGTMWEDLGKDGVEALMDVTGSADKTLDKMTEIKEVKYDDLNSQIAEISRTFQMQLADKVETSLPIIKEGLEFVGEHIDIITIGTLGLAGAVMTLKGADFIENAAGKIGKLAGSLGKAKGAAEGATEGTSIFHAVLNANPYVIAATGLAALIGAATYYHNTTESCWTETEKLVKTLEEETKAREELDETIRNNTKSREEAEKSLDTEWETVELLGEKLLELNEVENKSAGQKETMKTIVEELSGKIPELAEAYDEETGSIDMTEEALRKLIETSEEAAKMEAAKEKLGEIAKDVVDAEINFKQALDAQAEVKEKLKAAEEKAKTANYNDYQSRRDVILLKKEYKSATEEVENYRDTLKTTKNEMKRVEDYIEDTTNATKENTKATKKVANTAENVYTKTRNAFKKMSKETKKSGKAIPDGLKENFDEAVEKAEKLGIEIPDKIREGISNGGQSAVDAVADLNKLIEKEEKEAVENAKETAEEQTKAQAEGIKSKQTDVSNASKNTVKNANKEAKSEASNAKEIGTNVDLGITQGVLSGSGSVSEAVRKIVRNALNAGKKEAEINSPSKRSAREIGNPFTLGIAKGIKTGTKNAVDAAVLVCSSVLGAAQKETTKLSKKINKKIKNNFGVSRYEKSGKKKVKKKAKEYYAEIVSAAEQYLDNIKVIENLSLKQEETYWKKVIKKVKKGTQAWYDAKKNLKEVQAEIKEQAAEEKQEKREYGLSGDALEAYKTYYNVSAKAEMDYWDVVRKKFTKGTAERLEADQKYYEAKEEYYDQLSELDEEYAENCKEVNEQMKSDVEELTKAYDDAVESRKNEILSSTGIFEKFESTGYTKDTLLYNLKTQVAGVELWKEDLGKLKGKGFSEAVLEQIEAMGPEAAASIHSLTEMSDAEIEEYNRLWEKKEALAEAQAKKENEELKKETETKIKAIQQAADEQIKAYTQKYKDSISALTSAMEAPLQEMAEKALQLGEETALKYIAGINNNTTFDANVPSAITGQIIEGIMPVQTLPYIDGNDYTGSAQRVTSYASTIDTSGVALLNKALETGTQITVVQNTDTNDTLEQVLQAVEKLGDRIEGLEIVLDTGTTVGQLQPAISRESALQIIRNRRGGRI